MKCQKCGADLAEGVLFCRECGAKTNAVQKRFCRECGAELIQNAKFCRECGAKAELPSFFHEEIETEKEPETIDQKSSITTNNGSEKEASLSSMEKKDDSENGKAKKILLQERITRLLLIRKVQRKLCLLSSPYL